MIFHIFICILHLLCVYYELTMWPASSWFGSSVCRALHQYCRGHGFKSVFNLTTAQVVCITAIFNHAFNKTNADSLFTVNKVLLMRWCSFIVLVFALCVAPRLHCYPGIWGRGGWSYRGCEIRHGTLRMWLKFVRRARRWTGHAFLWKGGANCLMINVNNASSPGCVSCGM